MSAQATPSEAMQPAPRSHSPRWYTIPVRVAVVTFIGTLLSFCFALLLAIIGTVIVAALQQVHPDMRIAYRRIALPSGAVGGVVILVLSLIAEIRHYRQSKTLSSIERIS
jgi:purine-cytosine permease-like protein